MRDCHEISCIEGNRAILPLKASQVFLKFEVIFKTMKFKGASDNKIHIQFQSKSKQIFEPKSFGCAVGYK